MLKDTGAEWEPYHHETNPPHTPVSYMMLIDGMKTQYLVAGRYYGEQERAGEFYYFMNDGKVRWWGLGNPKTIEQAMQCCERDFLQKDGEQLSLL